MLLFLVFDFWATAKISVAHPHSMSQCLHVVTLLIPDAGDGDPRTGILNPVETKTELLASGLQLGAASALVNIWGMNH